jgi:hypothetical protein
VPQAAIGFKVKSGRTVAVLLVGTPATPRVADNRMVALSDPDDPGARQPYHAGTGVAQTDDAVLRPLLAGIERYASRTLADLLKDYRATSSQIAGAGVVVGSTADPTMIANPHIRAHAFEGKLFRTVLEDGLRTLGVPATVVLERELYRRASHTLGRSESDLKRELTTLGREVAGPWRAEQKVAALAAWMVMAAGGPGRAG